MRNNHDFTRKIFPGKIWSEKIHRNLFTLIELLIVISIIAILASLLLPALEMAKKKAHGISCLNGEKQLAVAFISYTADNRDRLPHYTSPRGTDGIDWHMNFILLGYLPKVKPLICPSLRL